MTRGISCALLFLTGTGRIAAQEYGEPRLCPEGAFSSVIPILHIMRSVVQSGKVCMQTTDYHAS